MIDIPESENARQLSASDAQKTSANAEKQPAIKARWRNPVKSKDKATSQAKAQICKICKQQKDAAQFYADNLGICRVCWANQLYSNGIARSA